MKHIRTSLHQFVVTLTCYCTAQLKPVLTHKKYPLSGASLDDAGQHFSATERRADEASRSVTTWLKCHYMQQHLGAEFVGTISAVAEFGLFVTLKDLYVDGMVHVSQLGDDFFVFDQSSQSLSMAKTVAKALV